MVNLFVYLFDNGLPSDPAHVLHNTGTSHLLHTTSRASKIKNVSLLRISVKGLTPLSLEKKSKHAEVTESCSFLPPPFRNWRKSRSFLHWHLSFGWRCMSPYREGAGSVSGFSRLWTRSCWSGWRSGPSSPSHAHLQSTVQLSAVQYISVQYSTLQ